MDAYFGQKPLSNRCLGAAMTILALDRFNHALAIFPPPGEGKDCNLKILGAANHGVHAGLNPEDIFRRIREAIPAGHRRVSDGEIIRAVNKAMADHRQGAFKPRPRPSPVVQDGKKALRGIIAQGSINTEVDLWEASPIRLWDEPQQDPVLFLDTLYQRDDLLFIGERHDAGVIGKTIRTRDEWIGYFRAGGQTAPHFIINPLTGDPASTKGGGKETLRGDGCVATFRYCLIEFDNLTRDEQIRFWSSIRLPVVALIDSGGKSIHGILDVRKLAQVLTLTEWATHIRGRLYDRILKPLGIDMACSNPARLSRLPGHFRMDKRNGQSLLWLSEEGRTITA